MTASMGCAAVPLAFTDLTTALALLPGLVIGLTLHEFAHAASANFLGDRFARRQGRLSLNPFRHLSPLGTLAILLLPFGWAKPVTVNVYNFRRPKWDYLLTSLAGPAANVLVVATCVGLMYLTRHSYAFGPRGEGYLAFAHLMLWMVLLINAFLAVLNLLPIPPLDGSKIWPLVLGRRITTPGPKRGWIYVVLLLLLFRYGVLDKVFGAVVGALDTIVPTSDFRIVHDKSAQAAEAYDGNDFAKAEGIYDEILAITGDAPDFLMWRASCRAEQHNWAGTMADCNRVLQLGEGDPSAEDAIRAVRELRRAASEALASESQPASDDSHAPAGKFWEFLHSLRAPQSQKQ